jgi:hypothetical protein
LFWAGSRTSRGAGRVAAVVAAQLVHLVEHQHRVVDPGPAHRLDDAPGHGADVGAAVAAQLRLVVQPAQAEALELAAQRPGDRLAQRGLAHPRRAHQAQDGRLGLRVELQHRQVLKDALLHLFQVVVVLVEHLAGVVDVDDVLRRLPPGQFQHQLQVRADHLVVRRGGGQALQPVQLALRLLAHLVGQVGLGQALAQLVDLRLLGALLAQLALDGLHLLAQHVLALLLGHLRLDLPLDLLAQLEHLHLVGQVAVQQAQALPAARDLQQRLLLGHVQAEHRAQ